MKFTTSEVVRGFSNMAYNIDGQSAQVKVIYIDVELNAEHGGKGTRTDAKAVAEPKIIEDAFQGRSFPCVCELDFEERATKGKVALVCVAIRAKAVDLARKAA
jgi:hypothetical protein